MKSLFAAILICLLSTLSVMGQVSSDEEQIENLVHEFLEKVAEENMHNRFWNDKLVYTSSSGSRFGKNQIMSGFKNNADETNKPSPYSAENIDIRVFGNIAVLNFTLVNDVEGSKTYYLNSGVFKKTKGQWSVINWQATSQAIE